MICADPTPLQLVRRRLPPVKVRGGLMNLRAFRSAPYSLYVLSSTLGFLGMYACLTFISVSAVDVGTSAAQLRATVLNAVFCRGIVGFRLLPCCDHECRVRCWPSWIRFPIRQIRVLERVNPVQHPCRRVHGFLALVHKRRDVNPHRVTLRVSASAPACVAYFTERK